MRSSFGGSQARRIRHISRRDECAASRARPAERGLRSGWRSLDRPAPLGAPVDSRRQGQDRQERRGERERCRVRRRDTVEQAGQDASQGQGASDPRPTPRSARLIPLPSRPGERRVVGVPAVPALHPFRPEVLAVQHREHRRSTAGKPAGDGAHPVHELLVRPQVVGGAVLHVRLQAPCGYRQAAAGILPLDFPLTLSRPSQHSRLHLTSKVRRRGRSLPRSPTHWRIAMRSSEGAWVRPPRSLSIAQAPGPAAAMCDRQRSAAVEDEHEFHFHFRLTGAAGRSRFRQDEIEFQFHLRALGRGAVLERGRAANAWRRRRRRGPRNDARGRRSSSR